MRALRFLVVAALALIVAACGRREAPRVVPVPMEVVADSGSMQTLKVVPPRAWLARVSETAPAAAPRPPASDIAAGAELPQAVESAPIPDSPPPALEIDDDLKPPIPRGMASLTLPPGYDARHAEAVELDIRVDESGDVSDAMWAGGAADSSLVQAAIQSALAMRFYPALKSGRPIAVWCRQRVEIGRR